MRTDKLLPGQAGKRAGIAKDKRLFIDTNGRLVERHAARIRELEQQCISVFAAGGIKEIWKMLADTVIGEPAE